MSGLSEAQGIYGRSVEQMLVWLREENLHDCVRPFSLKKINGKSFLNLSDFDIKSLAISQESKRKLVKVLQKAKGKKKVLLKSNGVETSRERRKPPSFTLDDEEDDSDDGGWATDDFDDSEDEPEEESVVLRGEYIQREIELPQESPKKEVPNIPSGLVAQLRQGLAGSINRSSLFGHPPPQHNHNQDEDPDDIYDEPPPDEDEVYEEPSDDSGSGVVIRNMSHQISTRSSSERSGYIDEWRSKNNARDSQAAPCPPRPPKPGRLLPAPVAEDSIQEFYEIPESEPLGPQVDEQYEIPGNEGPGQETYEVPDNNEPELYEEPEEGQQTELYEIPGQEEEIETYEVPDQSPAPPLRTQATSLKPSSKSTSTKPSLPSKPLNKAGTTQLGNKPAPLANKPKISQKPLRAPMPVPEKEFPPPPPPLAKCGSSDPKRLSCAPSLPTRLEKSNNEFPSPTSPLRTQTSVRRPVPTPVDDTPPPPPRPASKLHSSLSRIEKLPPKPPRLSESGNPEDDLVVPLDKLVGAKRPLPSKPEPKFPVDGMKNAPWFHGSLDRTEAESSLRSFRKDGAFIVRNNSTDPNKFSMSLYYNGHVRHLRIPRIGGKFGLGDSGIKQFNTIMELVDHYSQHNVELKTGGFTSLTVPCPIRK